MDRRAFVAGSIAVLASPRAAEAQRPGKIPRIGMLSFTTPGTEEETRRIEVFKQGLRERGYVEGQTIAIEARHADGRNELLPRLAAELVGLKVDVILTYGTKATRAAKQATATIPIVVREVSDATTINLVTGLDVDEYLFRTAGAVVEYHLADVLGSTVALTTGTGTVAAEYTYEPFGAVAATGSISSNDIKYSGREHDGTGLYYYRARYYDPGLQRFVSEDPIGFDGGLNVFAFANNNPLRYVDPAGLKALICSRPLAAGRAFGRHAYLVPDDTVGRATLSLFPENGQGVKRRNDPADRLTSQTRCVECQPKGKCGDLKECLEKSGQAYPVGAYYLGGPNSNTFAATLARKCCANGFPPGLGLTPGSNAIPPVPGSRAGSPEVPGGE